MARRIKVELKLGGTAFIFQPSPGGLSLRALVTMLDQLCNKPVSNYNFSY